MWRCRCECGNEQVCAATTLRSGASKSCGCLQRELARDRFTTHGGRKTRLYSIFHQMKDRCYNENNPRYPCYGKRGITICEEWLSSFSCFQKWALQSGYNDSLTIDRIDVNGPYCPENCRWVSTEVQNNNKRNNRFISFHGEMRTLAEWADIMGISYYTLYSRIVKLGWPIERALTDLSTTTKPTQTHSLSFQDETHSITEWSKISGLDRTTIGKRLKYGWTVEDALTVPVGGHKHKK